MFTKILVIHCRDQKIGHHSPATLVIIRQNFGR